MPDKTQEALTPSAQNRIERSNLFYHLMGRTIGPPDLVLLGNTRSFNAILRKVTETTEFREDVMAPLIAQRRFAEGRFSNPFDETLVRRCMTLLHMDDAETIPHKWSAWLHLLLRSSTAKRHAKHASAVYHQMLLDRAWQRAPAERIYVVPDKRTLRDRVLNSGLFDPAWYRQQNPDIGRRDAAEHYVERGHREGRAPSPYFDQQGYLARNGDVAEAGAVPILHWMDSGVLEGRLAPLTNIKRENRGIALSDLCNPTTFELPAPQIDEDFFVSIVTPTYNTDPTYLRELYVSLANQHYTHWQWAICDDGSSDADTIRCLQDLAATDNRISLMLAPKSRGISAATNTALAMARGNYIALVDHDDLIARDAFLKIWQDFCKNRHAELFYTDECKISMNNEIFDIFLKPIWSPTLLENTMYIGHLSVYNKEFVIGIGGFRTIYDGTQDFDLALRASRQLTSAIHVDVIGYLWRAIPGSTASSMSEKNYAIDRQRAAITDHAQAIHADATVKVGCSPGHWRIDYPLPEKPPLLSYVIPTGAGSRRVNGKDVNLIINCIKSMIAKEFYSNAEFVVIHNGDLSSVQRDFLTKTPNVRLITYTAPLLNLAHKINMGVTAARGDYVCLLNDDVEAITSRGGEALVAFMEANPRVGTIGPLCLFEDGRVQHNGVMLLEQGPTHCGILQSPKFPGHFHNLRMRREVFGITGALMIVRKDVYQSVGGFDETLPLNYNDVHFCQKLRDKGLTCVVDPDVQVYHFESATKVGTFKCEKETLFAYIPTLDDPYFNKRFDQRDPSFQVVHLDQRTEVDGVTFERWLDRRIGQRHVSLPAQPAGPKMTVGISVYDQPTNFLREMLASVMMQTYRNFEIVILDNGSTAANTLKWLDRLTDYPFIKVIRHKKNQGIAGGQRALLGAATGDYFLPLDADDFMTIDALAVIDKAIRDNPDAVYFYSDEFKSDPNSAKFAPFFKPSFDPLMLTNCCYISHQMAFRTEALRSVHAYTDDRATWCHDWDSTFRLVQQGIEPVHIPEQLYAWRINPGSTASAESGAKPEAVASQRFVLERMFAAKQLSEKLAVKPNRLGDNTGMWALEALQPIADVLTVDAERLWQEPGADQRQQLLSLIDSSPSARWLMIVLPQTDPEFALLALSAPAHLDDRIRVVGSMFTSSSTAVRWSGGIFAPEGVYEPNKGVDPMSGGYHGQLFTQRCVDAVAGANVLIRTDVLKQTLTEAPAALDVDMLMIMLGLKAAKENWFVATTPHLVTRATKAIAHLLPVDRAGLVPKAGPACNHSRWANGDRSTAHLVGRAQTSMASRSR